MSLWIAPFGSRLQLQAAEYRLSNNRFTRVCRSLRYSHRTRAMPGHPRSELKNSRDLSPFLGAKCCRILNDPVTLHSCNCRVYATCADSAIDHRAGTAWCQLCGEELKQRHGKYYVSKILHAIYLAACMVHGILLRNS